MLEPILIGLCIPQRSTYATHMESGMLNIALDNSESDSVFFYFIAIQQPVCYSNKKFISFDCFVNMNIVEKQIYFLYDAYTGPILQSKGMHAIFQKKGKIFENLGKTVQNLKIFGKRAGDCAIIACSELLEIALI